MFLTLFTFRRYDIILLYSLLNKNLLIRPNFRTGVELFAFSIAHPSREFASTSRGGEVGSDDEQFKRNDFLCNDIR